MFFLAGRKGVTVSPGALPPAPVAVNDSPAAVTENTGNQDIDVLANDTYSGTPTIVITDADGSGATVTGTGVSSRIRIPTDTASPATYNIIYSLSATGNTGSDTATLTIEVEAEVTGEYIVTLENQGGLTDETDPADVASAFSTCITLCTNNAGSSSTGRGVIELVQGKTYTCDASNGGSTTGLINGAITLDVPNVEIRTQGKPTIASGNQAVLQWESWLGKSGVQTRAIVRVEDNNCKLSHLTIDGNKLSTGADASARLAWFQSGFSSTAGNGGVMNMVLYESDGFRMQEVLTKNAMIDGIFVRARSTNTISDVLVEDCTFDRNRRQGMSIIDLGQAGQGYDQVIFRRCTFSNTGDEAACVGEKPGVGVDIEPLNTTEPWYGLTFDECTFDSNQGSSVEYGNLGSQTPGRGLVSDSHSDSIDCKVKNCTFIDNRNEAVRLNMREAAAFTGLLIEDCTASGNGENTIYLRDQNGDEDTTFEATLVNNDFDFIRLVDLQLTGNNVVVWPGDYSPTVTNNNGAATLTVETGFPPGYPLG